MATTYEGYAKAGRTCGELMGIAPTQRKLGVVGIEILRVEDWKYREQRASVDFPGIMRQLDVVPIALGVGEKG